MINNKTYTTFLKCRSLSVVWKVVACMLFIACYAGNISYAKIETSTNNIYTDNYVTVTINVEGLGMAEIPAIVKDDIAYLSVTDIFDLLKIKNEVSVNFDAISGFIVNEKATFVIDKLNNRITYQDKVFNLKPEDILLTESNMYLRSNYFGDVFGLQCDFNFRNLSVILTAKFELPAAREARIDNMRRSMGQLQGTLKADTVIKRTYPAFHFGAADWNITASQQTQGGNNVNVNTRLGAAILGGEASLLLNYTSNQTFDEKQQYYYWRYANNDNKIVKQVVAGKIPMLMNASVFAPLVGVQISNTPTTYRRSFGTYTLSNTTQPGWLVELYVNNILIDYKKADASGFYTFQVPLVYGTSNVKLRFYGPYGEERSKEETINVPFNFLPAKIMEYNASAGIVEDGKNTQFSRVVVNYGLNRHMTVGGGMEYLSSVTSGTVMPFINTSIMVTSRLLAMGDYIYGVRGKGLLTYRLPSNMQFQLDYTKYNEGQTAINIAFKEERKASVSIPIRTKSFTLFSRMGVANYILPETKYSTTEWLLSGSLFGINTNISTYATFFKGNDPYIFTTMALSLRMPKKYLLTPQIQYNYEQKKLVSLRATLEKYYSNIAYLNIFCERNMAANIISAGVGVRYNFNKVQVGATVQRTGNDMSFVESARGSFICDAKTNYISTNTYINVGRSGISVIPYLDLNCNGHRDKEEPMANSLKFHINGGRIDKGGRDSVTHVLDLEPYTSYIITLDSNSFDNIAWKLQKKIIRVNTAPNQFTTVEIPVSVVGEASGSIYIKTNHGQKEQGRIKIVLLNGDGKIVNRTVSDMGGFFVFENMAPGSYTVRVDTTQLKDLNLFAQPATINFTMYPNPDGDVVERLRFTLMSPADTIAAIQQATDTTVLSNVAITKITDSTSKVVSAPRLQIKNYKKPIPATQETPFMIHMKENKDTYIQLYNVVMPPPCVLGFYIYRKLNTSTE